MRDFTSGIFQKHSAKEVSMQIEIHKFIIRSIFAEAIGICTEITWSMNCEFRGKLKNALTMRKQDQMHFQISIALSFLLRYIGFS